MRLLWSANGASSSSRRERKPMFCLSFRKMIKLQREMRAEMRTLERAYHRLVKEVSDFRYDIAETLERIELLLTPSTAVRFVFETEVGGKMKEVSSMQMKISDKAVLKLKAVDKFGNPAAVDGAPVWSLTDPALGVLSPSEDGLTAEFVPAGTMGSLSVQASADADSGRRRENDPG
jgi:hypothetical protein